MAFDYTDQDRNEEIANQLEEYIDFVDKFVILPNATVKDINKATETIKKAIKHLRKGEPEKVFDIDACEDYNEYDEDEYY